MLPVKLYTRVNELKACFDLLKLEIQGLFEVISGDDGYVPPTNVLLKFMFDEKFALLSSISELSYRGKILLMLSWHVQKL